MRIVVVMVGILVATISVTEVSPRLVYAQNATATSIPPEIVCKMEPTSAECVQPSNSGSSISAPRSLPIGTTPSLLSPSSIPPEVECKLNPNSVVCLQLSKPVVSPLPPPPSITTRQLLLPSSPIPPEILCKMDPNSVVCLQLSKPVVSPPPHAIPEFGTGASTALLSVALAVVVIIASAKFGTKSKLIQK